MIADWEIRAFLQLASLGWHVDAVTSEATVKYNCIAWAAEDDSTWWWPSPGYYWPIDGVYTDSVANFVNAFSRLGYVPCDNAGLEPESEKVAIYANGDRVEHMARQLPSGLWTSKLGPYVDVRHQLAALENHNYGRVVQVLKRPAT